MLDEQDQGARIGVVAALGVALLVAIGLVLWLAARSGMPPARPAAATSDAFIDAPISGEKVGALYFAVGDAALPADAAAALAEIRRAAEAAPGKRIVLSGFHDPTGDPIKNTELAKNRAKAVRAALQGEGLPEQRIVLRKPESTTGSGTDQEARRVEVRLAD
jgi:outer membrane protein OmpA-like peptidoglycan-associated protein